MKFLSLAVAALIGMTEGKRTLTSEQLKTRMAKGQFNKETLMRGAKPYGETTRRLEEGEQEEWEINGLYSVQFSSCVSLSVQDDDLFSDELISYSQAGLLKAEKSYIIFTACQSSSCYNQSSDQKRTFITDIVSFFQAFADFLPNQVENYCEGCNRNYDYCMGNLEANDEAADAEDEAAQEQEPEQEQEAEQEPEQEQGEAEGEGEQAQEGGRRKLAKVMGFPERQLANNNKVVQMIDCDMCTAYECFEDAQAAEQQQDDSVVTYDFDDALNWLDSLSQCQQMENTYQDLPLYAGLMCNADGTGIEIAVFMDDDCSVYAPKLSYGKMMSESDSQYFSMTEEIVEYMFTNDFSCYQPDIEYTNPYEYQQNDEQANEEEQQEDPEAAEWCNNLFDGNMEALNLANCGADDNAADENQEEDANLATYSWYSYQITADDADDGAKVCQVIKGLNGGSSTLYDKKGSGTLYTYKKNWNKNKNGMRPGGVATLVIFIVLAAAAAAAFIVKKRKTNDKKTPLISENEGTLA